MYINKAPGEAVRTMNCVLSGNFKEKGEDVAIAVLYPRNNEQSLAIFQWT